MLNLISLISRLPVLFVIITDALYYNVITEATKKNWMCAFSCISQIDLLCCSLLVTSDYTRKEKTWERG